MIIKISSKLKLCDQLGNASSEILFKQITKKE